MLSTTPVALVDRSSVGRIVVTGADRLDLLHRLSTNNLTVGRLGDNISTVFTTDKGRLVDYVHVLIRTESLVLLTSPNNEENLIAWIDRFTIMEDIHLSISTQSTALFELTGVRAKEFGETFAGKTLLAGKVVDCTLPFGNVTITYRNEFQTDFLDVIVDASLKEEVGRRLVESVQNFGGMQFDSDEYERFRISRGIPKLGSEISETYNPYEAGLVHAISFTKGCYIGQEVIARLDTYQKVQRTLVGIVLGEACDGVQSGSAVICNGAEVGELTSISPRSLSGPQLCLAILKKGAVRADDQVSVLCGPKSVNGVVRSFPIVL